MHSVETSAAPSRLVLARFTVGIAILAAQVASVTYAHFGPAPTGQSWFRKALDGCSAEPVGCRRYVAWAPNDYVVEYTLAVEVGGRNLSFRDALGRYHYPPSHRRRTAVYEDPPQRLIDTIERYERAHRDRTVRVLLTYTVNGGPRHEWRWPHP
jgi:hypothetical protein